jgi:hypothetical protein
VGIELEWEPKNIACQVALAGIKKQNCCWKNISKLYYIRKYNYREYRGGNKNWLKK